MHQIVLPFVVGVQSTDLEFTLDQPGFKPLIDRALASLHDRRASSEFASIPSLRH